MGLREDVKVQLEKDWHPKIPNDAVTIKQAQQQLKKGKSTVSISLDIKAIKENNEENVR